MTARIEEIQGRLNAATPGPWKVGVDHSRVLQDVAATIHVAHFGDSRNADLIANAPADLAYLLRLLREHDLLTQIADVAIDVVEHNGRYSELEDAVRDLLRSRGELGTDPSEAVDHHYEGSHDA